MLRWLCLWLLISTCKSGKNSSDKEWPTTCELLRIEEGRIGDRPQKNHCSERTSRDYLLLWRSDLRPLLLLQPDGSSLNQRLRAMLLPLRSRQNGPQSFQGHSLLKHKMTKPTQQCWFKTRQFHSNDVPLDTYHLRRAYKILKSNVYPDLKNTKNFLRSFDILRSWDQETESSMKEEAGDARQTEVGVVNPAIACAHFSCNGYLCLYLCGKQIQIQKTR